MHILIYLLFLLLVLYIVAIWPGRSRKERMELYARQPIAHRGFHDNSGPAPENSMAAFRKAVEMGYGIELDIRETSDGLMVVSHDDSLKRSAGIDRNISDMKWSELKDICLFQSNEHIPLFKDVDVIQIGARNMQNFDLLKAVGRLDKPILLKRGMSATYEELLMSAEYIMSQGNHNVILCERGIRTFETYTRNTLDLTCVPVLRKLTHLPIIIDPSHATGRYFLVPPMALAAVASGADGLEIEVHQDPQHAWSDGGQSLRPDKFDKLAGMLMTMHQFVQTQPIREWE